MSKIKLITKREFKNRVTKKAFIVMSILGPILFSAMFIVPSYIRNAVSEPWHVVVVDKSKTVMNYSGDFKFQDSPLVKFNLDHINEDYREVKTEYFGKENHCVIWINEDIIDLVKKINSAPKVVIPYNYKDTPPTFVDATIQSQVQELALLIRLNLLTRTENGMRPSDLIEVDVKLTPEDLDSYTEKQKQLVEYGLSIAGAVLIYMFILMFGSAVMKGVSEEKNSRIVEVLISSVKPFQLMMGKIVGIGLSAITQFVIWIALSFVLMIGFSSYFSNQLLEQQITQSSTMLGEGGNVTMASQQVVEKAAEMGTDQFLTMLHLVDWPTMCISFLFFFIGGYMLYSSLFAAIGSALDADTDANQFVFPLTLPLILSVFIAMSVMENPDSSIAQWASFIPFSSPIVMMARIPFGVPIWEVAVSMVILYGTAVLFTKFAGKIYRTGILMYGQKVNYKTLWKWLRY